ncbi:MAG: CRISPR-associated helicase Cas3 [uncultured Sulfurovum sp.]|uniref:CRISPR-associated helicase Cas3 n=1 Tax=uncultured Sulfurovum sp. TaxID=269237 RepID=A0A6S6SVR6_9BACT|nr:MAG: CRISPR-associated helicase Cas3 [uncultured Sulfurovum sp.]
MNYLSHPTQQLTKHIKNIQKYDHVDELFTQCVLFHDLGKVLDSFQSYIQKITKSSEPHAPVSGVIYLLNYIGNDFVIRKDRLFIFNSIISHHGKLKSFDSEYNSILEFFLKEIPLSQIDEIYLKEDVKNYFQLKDIDVTIFPMLNIINRDLKFTIEDYITQKLLFSKLIFADKYEAIYKSEHKKVFNTNSVVHLHQELDKIIKKRDPKRDKVKNDILNAYDKSYTISTLTAPTGIGKTLTSLELALKIKEDKKLSKIIYILPFTSIIDQTYETFDKIFPNEITKHHYAVTFDENSDNQDEKNTYDRWKFILNSWNEPFILSTLYQLFFAIFSNKNSDNIKFQALQNSVIILDEVQAIPFELWKAFKEILPILSEQLNSTFILMSATMPILTQKNVALELANKTEIFEAKNRYVLKYLEGNTLENLASVIIELYQEGKSVLCVVNSIKTSKLLYKIVKKSVENSYCLNSYMFFDDRKEVIRSIKDNEKGSNVTNKILISTQVIEAGVDLDFDVGLREFAPISSIIQTAGRVNREGKKGISEIYIFDTITKVYNEMMISESKKSFFDVLKRDDIYEKNILPFVECYFQALDENKGDSGILSDIERFDFDAISKKNRDAFGLEEDYIKSVALGVDLKAYQYRYFENIKGLKPYEIKRKKEKLMREFQSKILNIKEKDLNALEFEIPFSDIFGIYYIVDIKDIYSKESGFQLKEEKTVNDAFEFP